MQDFIFGVGKSLKAPQQGAQQTFPLIWDAGSGTAGMARSTIADAYQSHRFRQLICHISDLF